MQWIKNRIKEMHERDAGGEAGFTLIELLVVVIIIGILAAIAIPTFLAQRERAWEAAAQSDLRNAAAAATSCSAAAGNDGSFTNCAGDATILEPFGYNASENVTITAVQNDANGWAATTTNTNDDGTTFRFDSDNAGGIQGRVFCDATVNATTGGADCP